VDNGFGASMPGLKDDQLAEVSCQSFWTFLSFIVNSIFLCFRVNFCSLLHDKRSSVV